MNTIQLQNLIGFREGSDFGEMQAEEFLSLVSARLKKFAPVSTEVKVPDRGDGRSGRIDIVFHYKGESIPIEVDRLSPRIKSVFKVKNYNPINAFCIVRSPFKVIKV